jgi:hypothetical protein
MTVRPFGDVPLLVVDTSDEGGVRGSSSTSSAWGGIEQPGKGLSSQLQPQRRRARGDN